MLAGLLDLALPAECAGCGAAGTGWCARCASGLATEPVAVRPRVAPGAPVWSAGVFAGPRRGAVIALKEHGRRDAAAPLAAALARMIAVLRQAGELDPPELAPLILVPAPSRASAARRRGGDPVARIARLATRTPPSGPASPGAPDRAVQALRLRAGARDSVGLGAGERQRNLAGRVALRRSAAARLEAVPVPGVVPRTPAVVFVDDVVTTGATAAESVRVLADAGVTVRAVLVLGHA
ncbi:ComF family protein [Tomitella fengzijianii]|uniref:ComF family protein n=1 Tax=Tomitella fengzijianii TaxID=2597660 RepID=A0A516X7J8_9ACTN|nr:ComF family protein [Tomitella fengzijianii]QDQ99042.1 ComF family protein [Tomitella fengzijianii]